MKKIIHYFYDDADIWKKGKSPIFRICFASWKKYCPDYEIKCWHDKMPEFQQMLKNSRFLRECYKSKMWAFVADYVRQYVLYNYGGIYLDTDVQLIGNFDKYLDDEFFISVEGDILNGQNIVEPAVMGGEKGHEIFKRALDFYNSDEIFKLDYLIAPVVITKQIQNIYGFDKIPYSENVDAQQYYDSDAFSKELDDYNLYLNEQIYEKEGIKIYPSEYFCPAWNNFKEKAFTDNTVSIHWNQSSWWGHENDRKIRRIKSLRFKNPLRRFLFMETERFVKLLTLFIIDKNLRKNIRKNLNNYFEKIGE